MTLRSHSQGESVRGVKPVAGNQRRLTAKMATRMRPNQKFGTACPNVAPSVAKRSTQELGPQRRRHPCRDADHDRDQRRHRRQRQRDGKPLHHGSHHADAVEERGSKIPLHSPAEPLKIAKMDRLVQAEPLAQHLVLFGRAGVAEDQVDGIARQQRRERERQHRDDEQQRHECEEPLNNEPEHGDPIISRWASGRAD